MKRALTRLAVVSALAVAPALAPLTASAQTSHPAAPQAPLAQSLTGAARDAYTSAQILSNNSDFVGALAKLQQAYELSKDPRLLFNMALCERSLHGYARMQSLLSRYKRDAGPSIAPEDKADVDAALAAIRSLVGALRVAVNEPGATVSVDGESIGVTPLTEPQVLDLGKHTLVVSKAGFDSVSQTVTILGGNEAALAVTLVAQRRVAQLVVTSDDGATVFVDGKVAGQGRFDGQLAPGIHEVRVTEPGKKAYQAELELRDGETRTADVTLESEKHGGSPWPWIAGGVAVVAGAVVGGYFLFKQQPAAAPPPPDQLGSLQLSAWGR